MVEQSLRSSPLENVHEQLGATFTDFAGWRMPVRYESDLAEHRAVRERAGIFDLSHMGQIAVVGDAAGEALDYALAGKVSSMSVGRAKYTLLLSDSGGVIDDLIVYRLTDEHYLVVANASNAQRVLAEMTERTAHFPCEVRDESAQTALIAVQGPLSERIIIETLTGADTPASDVNAEDVTSLKYYRAAQAKYAGANLLIARTGYTGEDGFELYVPVEHATELWEHLRKVGGEDLTPCGLASRDTLRLEAGMPLYGNELSENIVPAQAGLGRVVAFSSKEDFVGRAALENLDAESTPVLVGISADGRRAARAGAAIRTTDGTEIGTVTSGALAPTLGHPIAMGYVDPQFTEPGTELVIDVRGKDLPARVVDLPFYTREANA